MQSKKQGLLVAMATAALIAGAGSAHAQAEKKMDSPGGTQTQSGAETQKQKKSGAQIQEKSERGLQTEAPGTQAPRGQVQDKDMKQAPRGQAQERDMKKSPGQAQPQTQGTGSKTAVQLNEQQRARISQTVKQKSFDLRTVERSRVNFRINLGAVVPRTIELYPLPAPIVQIVPAYRGYLYIVVGDELLIIHPQTYEIVAVIPA